MAADETPERALSISCLLIASAGFLDSFAWLRHGHVFTNAQTGNIVLIWVSIAGRDWSNALRYLPPLLAFFPGILAAQWIRTRKLAPAWSAAVIVAAEIAIIGSLGILSDVVASQVTTAGIAFAMAMQNSGFEKVGEWSFTSVVTTGNLRSLGEALFASLSGSEGKQTWRKTATLAAICGSFAVGAGVGAVTTDLVADWALTLPIGALLLALLAIGAAARTTARKSPVEE